MKRGWGIVIGALVIAGIAIYFLLPRGSGVRQVSVATKNRVLSTATSRPASAIDLNISYEGPPAPVRFYHKPFRWTAGLPMPGDLAPLNEGVNRIDLSDFPDGDHTLYIVSDDYAPQWINVSVKGGEVMPIRQSLKLFRKRYVIIRYAYNMAGGTELGGKDVITGRAALAQFGTLPRFGMDWQMWQYDRAGRAPGRMFGDVPMLDLHRMFGSNGFQAAPEGATFDSLVTAPASGYTPRRIEAKPGMILFCRVAGNRPKPPDQGYGKLWIEEVTTTRPTKVEIREPEYPVWGK